MKKPNLSTVESALSTKDAFVMPNGAIIRLTLSGFYSVTKDGQSRIHSRLSDAWKAAGLILLLLTGNAYSMTDREQIAATIAAEACGEGVEGMRLVAETIRNRATASHKSFLSVVSAKGQYYGYSAKNRARLYRSVKRQADSIVDSMYAGTLGNKTKGSLYFRQLKEPRFKWCKVETYRHKNHIFYK